MASASPPFEAERSNWDNQFTVTIDGETYSIKEAPAADSAVVARYQGNIVNTDLRTPFEGANVDFYIRLVRFSVAGERELETPVTRLINLLVDLTLDSCDAVKKVCSKLDRIVDFLVRGVNFLLGGADDVALRTLERFLEEVEQIKNKCYEQNHNLKKGIDEIEEFMRLFYEVLSKRNDEVLKHAGIGLRGLQMHLSDLQFWKTLPCAIEAASDFERCVNLPMKYHDQAEARAQFVRSEPYKHQIMVIYAKFVALKDKCKSFQRKLKLVEEGLPASLTDTLTVHDARIRAASMAELLKAMERAERLELRQDHH